MSWIRVGSKVGHVDICRLYGSSKESHLNILGLDDSGSLPYVGLLHLAARSSAFPWLETFDV